MLGKSKKRSRRIGYGLFFVAALLLVAPYVFIFSLGTVWIWQHGLVWFFAVGTGLPTLVGLALIERSRGIIFPNTTVMPATAPASTPVGREALQAVQKISERLQAENPAIERSEVLEHVARNVFWEMLETVARHYHPEADRPVLQTPVAHVAALVELVADDFRREFMRSMPWGKTVTLGRLLWWKEKSDLAWQSTMYLWQLNRIRRMCMRPATAIVQEVQDHFGQNLTSKSLDGLKLSALDFCIMKLGEYAVQLYSGGFVLEREYRPRLSAEVASVPFEHEPLQTLVVGQVKSGKSSLINLLLGEIRAPVDVLPTTDAVDLYECRPENLPPMILRDTPGYGAVDTLGDPFTRLKREIEECDLLLLVCSARSAARKADRELLGKIRDFYKQDTKRLLPPVVYVLTHIDAVPEHLIPEAVNAVAADFEIDPGQIVPICGQWGRPSNREGVAEALESVLPEAEKLKVARCIRQIRREQDEDKLIHQVINGLRLAGGWIAKK